MDSSCPILRYTLTDHLIAVNADRAADPHWSTLPHQSDSAHRPRDAEHTAIFNSVLKPSRATTQPTGIKCCTEYLRPVVSVCLCVATEAARVLLMFTCWFAERCGAAWFWLGCARPASCVAALPVMTLSCCRRGEVSRTIQHSTAHSNCIRRLGECSCEQTSRLASSSSPYSCCSGRAGGWVCGEMTGGRESVQ